MNKHGQVSAFMIIGVVLLIIVALALFLRENVFVEKAGAEFERPPLPEDIAPISNYVDKCIENVLTPGIFLLGAQGGYINPPDDSLITENAMIAYGSVNGENRLPDVNTIENELARYLEDGEAALALDEFDEIAARGIYRDPVRSSKSQRPAAVTTAMTMIASR